MGSVNSRRGCTVVLLLARLLLGSVGANSSKSATLCVQHHSRPSLWLRTAFIPMAAEAKTILTQLLLALQFCLGVWQIIKFTPLGGLLECIVKRWVLLPLGFSTPYAQLHGFPGRVYKTVTCHITIPSSLQPLASLDAKADRTATSTSLDAEADLATARTTSMATEYLQKSFLLERRGDRLFVNGAMAYYLTDAVWPSLVEMANAAPRTVFLKGYKEFWQQVATGGVMSFWEVLDSLILDNHSLLRLDNDLFLPVNLSVSEEKLLKFLNLAGLFLQTKNLPWLYPSLLSFTAAILEFCTPLRVWLYNGANRLFCCAIQAVAENVLSRQWRRQVYALGLWVENLKPSNDIELRILRRHKFCTVIAGGAKVRHKEDASAVRFHDDNDDEEKGDDGSNDAMEMDGANPDDKTDWLCYTEDGDQIELEAHFQSKQKKCWVRARTVAWVEVDCTFPEFKRLKTFLACVAKHRSGSMKTCDGHGKVRVRNFRESVMCYFRNKCPTVYELHLEKATVI